MTSLLSNKRFWLASTERAALTLAQTLAAELAVFSAVEVREKGLDGLPWYAMISVAVVAGLLSFLSSIGKGSSGSAGYKVELSKESSPDDPPSDEPEKEEGEGDPVQGADPVTTPEVDSLPLPDEVPEVEESGQKNPSRKAKGGSKKSK